MPPTEGAYSSNCAALVYIHFLDFNETDKKRKKYKDAQRGTTLLTGEKHDLKQSLLMQLLKHSGHICQGLCGGEGLCVGAEDRVMSVSEYVA